MTKLMSALIAAVFAATTFSVAAQTPAPVDAPKAETTKAQKKAPKEKKVKKAKTTKKAKKSGKSAAPAATPK